MPHQQNKKKLIVIAGPTAVGKTSLAIRVARHFKTEIISADSRQIYRELSIGTAKPSETELNAVPHHFINSHSIHDDYDAASYGEEALQQIEKLFLIYNEVVLVGGSGLYIKAVLDGFDNIPEISPAVRESLITNYETRGLSWLQEQMMELDPEHYQRIDQQNPHRLIRALEVKIGTGSSIASFQKKEKRTHSFDVIRIGLELPKEDLYRRIDERMDNMIEDGLFEEAEKYYRMKHLNALQTVGYQEIYGYLDENYDRDEAIRLLKRNSRRYAKRQMTWFKRDPAMIWFSPEHSGEIIQFLEDQIGSNPA